MDFITVTIKGIKGERMSEKDNKEYNDKTHGSSMINLKSCV